MHDHPLVCVSSLKSERPGTACRRLVAAEPGRLVHRLPLLSRAALWDTGDGWVAISVKVPRWLRRTCLPLRRRPHARTAFPSWFSPGPRSNSETARPARRLAIEATVQL
jgi:hypothetical protein